MGRPVEVVQGPATSGAPGLEGRARGPGGIALAEWFLDPKSITLLGGTALVVAASVWQGRQTAAVVADLVKWRLETAVKTFAEHETRLGHVEGETIDLVTAYQVAGHPDPEYRHHIACHACPGIGSCGGMFTYNTMQTFIGVLGMEPLHMVAPTAEDHRRIDEFPGQLIDCLNTMTERGIRPRDIVTPASDSEDLYNAAQDPRRLVVLPGVRHYEIYSGEPLRRSSAEAVAWFSEHLGAEA